MIHLYTRNKYPQKFIAKTTRGLCLAVFDIPLKFFNLQTCFLLSHSRQTKMRSNHLRNLPSNRGENCIRLALPAVATKVSREIGKLSGR